MNNPTECKCKENFGVSVIAGQKVTPHVGCGEGIYPPKPTPKFGGSSLRWPVKPTPNTWEERFDSIGFGNQAMIVGSRRKELKDFIREELALAKQEGKEEAVSFFEEVEKEKWTDVEHCSCLRHAIWKAKGEPEEVIENVMVGLRTYRAAFKDATYDEAIGVVLGFKAKYLSKNTKETDEA